MLTACEGRAADRLREPWAAATKEAVAPRRRKAQLRAVRTRASPGARQPKAIDDDMITFSIAPQNKGVPVPEIFDRSADAP
ncbi:hypothetical protein ACFXPJ_18565 [Streptomyces goshikiensis]